MLNVIPIFQDRQDHYSKNNRKNQKPQMYAMSEYQLSSTLTLN